MYNASYTRSSEASWLQSYEDTNVKIASLYIYIYIYIYIYNSVLWTYLHKHKRAIYGFILKHYNTTFKELMMEFITLMYLQQKLCERVEHCLHGAES
jgi:hypothetical protein